MRWLLALVLPWITFPLLGQTYSAFGPSLLPKKDGTPNATVLINWSYGDVLTLQDLEEFAEGEEGIRLGEPESWAQVEVQAVGPYPVPTRRDIHLQVSFTSAWNGQWGIWNAEGKQVVEKNFIGPDLHLTYSLENLPSGIYYLYIKNKNINYFHAWKIQKTN